MRIDISRILVKKIAFAVSIILILTTALYVVSFLLKPEPGKSGLKHSSCDVKEQEYPFILPYTRSYLETPEQLWVGYYLQPVITGFESKNGKNYVTTQYLDYQGECQYLDLLVSGDIGIEDKYNQYDAFSKNFLNNELMSFEEMKESLEIGQQIKIFYHHTAPDIELLDEEFCNKFDIGSKLHCTIQLVNDHVTESNSFNLESGKKVETLFVGVIFTDVLSAQREEIE